MKKIRPDLPADTYFWHISRIACFALAVLSVCVLKLTFSMIHDPTLALSVGPTVPEMIKNVLVGCASVFLFGFLFELAARR